jgi:hypothetical protein
MSVVEDVDKIELKAKEIYMMATRMNWESTGIAPRNLRKLFIAIKDLEAMVVKLETELYNQSSGLEAYLKSMGGVGA